MEQKIANGEKILLKKEIIVGSYCEDVAFLWTCYIRWIKCFRMLRVFNLSSTNGEDNIDEAISLVNDKTLWIQSQVTRIKKNRECNYSDD